MVYSNETFMALLLKCISHFSWESRQEIRLVYLWSVLVSQNPLASPCQKKGTGQMDLWSNLVHSFLHPWCFRIWTGFKKRFENTIRTNPLVAKTMCMVILLFNISTRERTNVSSISENELWSDFLDREILPL